MAILLFSIVPLTAAAQSRPVVFRGALVVDGTGAPGRHVDVRIARGRITAIGKLIPAAADSVVDATGYVLTPGFIDTHSHHDRGLLEHPDALGAISQGITTIVVGQDGGSQFPLADFFGRLEKTPVAPNVASYVGHGTLRDRIMGADFKRPASAAEVRLMGALLKEEMKAGALGLSSGLEYDPGIYSAQSELVSLARIAGANGGRYISHVRSEDRHFWSAINELITIGREAHVPVQLSHAKLAMRSLWGHADSLIGILDAARQRGVNVTLDIYPYTYWFSTLTVLFPERNFQDRAEATFAMTEVAPAESAFVTSFEPDTSVVGQSIATIAARRGADPATTLMSLIAQIEAPRPGGGEWDEGVMATSMSAADMERLVQWPYASVSSDGGLDGAHPRGFGAFPRYYRLFVREGHVLSLEQAIRHMTSLSAHNMGITNRGSIAVGMAADLVLLDTTSLSDRSSQAEPHRVSSGVRGVWVNGILTYNGKTTGAHPGQVIRRERRKTR
ncbi:MAG: amidohydrolase family protein [Gemmatimonadota bacterium]